MVNYLFFAIVLLLPLQFALNTGENFDLVTTRVLIPALFLLWLARGLARKKIWIPNKAEMWLVAIFLFFSSLSLFLGREAEAGWRKLIYLSSIFPVFFVAADIFQEKKWRKKGVAIVIFSGSLAALIALFQFSLPFAIGLGKAVNIWEKLTPFFLGNSFGKLVAANSSWLVNIGGQTRMRAFGFFPDPHSFSFFVNLCLFAGIGYFFDQKKIGPKIWIGLGIALMLAGTFFSFARGAYLGLFAGTVFFGIVFLKRSGLLKKALAVGALSLVLALFFNSNIISQRLSSSFNLKEGSNAERYKNWVQAVEIIKDHPLGGVGLGNYARVIDPTAKERSSIYAHNLFLDIAAETGILNAAAFLLLVFVSIWRNIKSGHTINLGLAAGLVGFSVHSIFDTALFSPQALVIFLIIVALGLYNSESSRLSSRA
jgi:O-antigen ligase